jgi:hypothetical protein
MLNADHASMWTRRGDGTMRERGRHERAVRGLFELVGEAAGKVAEITVESAGAVLEGTTSVASAVAAGAGPAPAGAAAKGVAVAAGEGPGRSRDRRHGSIRVHRGAGQHHVDIGPGESTRRGEGADPGTRYPSSGRHPPPTDSEGALPPDVGLSAPRSSAPTRCNPSYRQSGTSSTRSKTCFPSAFAWAIMASAPWDGPPIRRQPSQRDRIASDRGWKISVKVASPTS